VAIRQYQALSRQELHVRYLQIVPVVKGEDWISPVFLTRSSTRGHIHPPVHLHIVSQVSAHHLPRRTQSSIQLSLHREAHVRHLQIRIVSQGVFCVHSVYLASRLRFWVCFFTHPHGNNTNTI